MSSDPSAKTLPPQQLDAWFLDLLACPACEQHWPLKLSESKDTLLCGCGRYCFPIHDGIPDLLVDSATLLDENAHPENVRPDAAKA